LTVRLDSHPSGPRVAAGRPSAFASMLACVDGSYEGYSALLQAARLSSVESELSAVAVCGVHYGVHEPLEEAIAPRKLGPCAADDAAREARRLVPGITTRVVEGGVIGSLLELVEDSGTTFLAVGTHGRSGAYGIPLGGVATAMLREAPCTVLIARPPVAIDRFPRSIVVGVDGSPESLRAAAVGEQLAARLQVPVRFLAATGGKSLEVGGLAASAIDVEWDERAPVTALVAASVAADLIVVGHRGLHEGEALGSVSRRVAEKGSSSVLVVRDPDLSFSEVARE
jgi:nucleotide-binding universal stress UspA family protein